MLTASPPCMLTLYLSTGLTFFAFEEALCCWLGLLGMLLLESLGLAVETQLNLEVLLLDWKLILNRLKTWLSSTCLSSFLSGSNIALLQLRLARSPPTSVSKYRLFAQLTLPSAFKEKISFPPSLTLLISFLIHMDFPESTYYYFKAAPWLPEELILNFVSL